MFWNGMEYKFKSLLLLIAATKITAGQSTDGEGPPPSPGKE